MESLPWAADDGARKEDGKMRQLLPVTGAAALALNLGVPTVLLCSQKSAI
jgi:hypothetical protein